ncbi:MAG: hypothetical protein JXX29_11190 [Deltaproteobacteria bacterium]|nr:hypothetical protein [Deltaproteobacteria bacterium]MBN2672235.1 hypothetical protein [Deltaproteobacteria bacterium]
MNSTKVMFMYATLSVWTMLFFSLGCGEASDNSRADATTDGDADTDTDADTDSDADTDGDGDGDTDTDTDTDGDADADADADTDADSDSDTDTDSDVVIHGDYEVFEGGYWTSGPMHGYAWTAAVIEGSTVSPADYSELAAGGAFCASGVVAPEPDYKGVGMVGLNVNQEEGEDTPINTFVPTSEGLYVNVSNPGGSTLRVQIQGPEGETNADQRWCAPISQLGGETISWSTFNTACWNNSGAEYAMEEITAVIVLVPGSNSAEVPFEFCIHEVALDDEGGTQDTDDPTQITYGGFGTLSGTEAVDNVTRNGDYYAVQSNVWGGDGVQTISYQGPTFVVTQQTGDNSFSGAPVSYPSSFIGSCYGRDPQGDNLPIANSAISSVMTGWTWADDGVSGVYNASYDVWFSETAAGDSGAPSAGYLMVWLYDPDTKQPRGDVIDYGATIAGISGTWDVWTDGDCISYVSTTKRYSMEYDLNDFIQDATSVHTGTIANDDYLTNVFAGFEIWSGGTGLETIDFYAEVN